MTRTKETAEAQAAEPEAFILPLEVKIPLSRVADLLCTGFEGGIGYWGQIVKYVKPPVLRWTMEKLDGRDDPTVYKHIDYPINQGGAVHIRQIEADDEPIAVLDLDAIRRGLRLMAEKHPRHFRDFVEENDDAITGDVFIQLCVFGEVVYG